MIAAYLQTDGSAKRTGQLMRQMVATYRGDMLPFVCLNISEVFDLIKDIPFTPDPVDAELLQRPMFTMNGTVHGGDCDDKCIALASYCDLVGIPWRFVAVRRADMPTLHHVMCEIHIGKNWIAADPTYSFNVLGRTREGYAERVVI